MLRLQTNPDRGKENGREGWLHRERRHVHPQIICFQFNPVTLKRVQGDERGFQPFIGTGIILSALAESDPPIFSQAPVLTYFQALP